MNGYYNNKKKSNFKSTDSLTNEEIITLLEDYVPIYAKDIKKFKHIRYFVTIDGERKFRYGGTVQTVRLNQGYIGLKNEKGASWTVQIQDGTYFFEKKSVRSIVKLYEKKIKSLEEKNKVAYEIIEKQKEEIKRLKGELLNS